MKSLSAALFALLLCCCSGSDGSPTAPTKMTPQQVELHIGQQATVDGTLHLRLTSVDNDSRCPTGVVCVWEGNAEVVLGVRSGNDQEQKLTLNTNSSSPIEGDFASYHIKLVNLAPYPHVDARIDPSQYVATLLVTR